MSSKELLTVREEFYNFWQSQATVWEKQLHCGFPSANQFKAFAVAKDWLQDTAEALLVHRRRGFDADPYQGYIELYGVLQAVFIQQDALAEMHFAIKGKTVPFERIGAVNSMKLRDLRNKLVGHPTRADRNPAHKLFRSVIPRQTMTYTEIRYVLDEDDKHSHLTVNLGKLLDDYDKEVAAILWPLLDLLKARF